MNSKRRHEGYLLVDHRDSPGCSEQMERNAEMPEGSSRGLFEAATITCSHCQKVLIVNPLRTRERAYCPKCDHYICDQCGAIRVANGGECKTVKQLFDELQELAGRRQE